MNLPRHIWDQIKNCRVEELQRALERDDWIQDATRGATLVYYHAQSGRRVVVHYHPGKTYGPKLLRGLLDDIGWTVEDLRRLKLCK